MRVAFTPGPWRHDCSFGQVGDVRADVEGQGDVSIANAQQIRPNVNDDGINANEERQANARLIAAAPELYEAGQAAVLALDHDYGFRRDQSELNCHAGICSAEKCGRCSRERAVREALDALKAAIAKVEVGS